MIGLMGTHLRNCQSDNEDLGLNGYRSHHYDRRWFVCNYMRDWPHSYGNFNCDDDDDDDYYYYGYYQYYDGPWHLKIPKKNTHILHWIFWLWFTVECRIKMEISIDEADRLLSPSGIILMSPWCSFLGTSAAYRRSNKRRNFPCSPAVGRNDETTGFFSLPHFKHAW